MTKVAWVQIPPVAQIFLLYPKNRRTCRFFFSTDYIDIGLEYTPFNYNARKCKLSTTRGGDDERLQYL